MQFLLMPMLAVVNPIIAQEKETPPAQEVRTASPRPIVAVAAGPRVSAILSSSVRFYIQNPTEMSFVVSNVRVVPPVDLPCRSGRVRVVPSDEGARKQEAQLVEPGGVVYYDMEVSSAWGCLPDMALWADFKATLFGFSVKADVADQSAGDRASPVAIDGNLMVRIDLPFVVSLATALVGALAGFVLSRLMLPHAVGTSTAWSRKRFLGYAKEFASYAIATAGLLALSWATRDFERLLKVQIIDVWGAGLVGALVGLRGPEVFVKLLDRLFPANPA